MTTETVTIEQAVEGFLAQVTTAAEANGVEQTYAVSKGRRWWKVVATFYRQESAWAFIDPQTGDVFKPDGWARPAKGIRGNVFSETLGIEAVNTSHIPHIWYAK